MLIAGEEKGNTGIVTNVIRSQNRVVVEGLNRVRSAAANGAGSEPSRDFLITLSAATGDKAYKEDA